MATVEPKASLLIWLRGASILGSQSRFCAEVTVAAAEAALCRPTLISCYSCSAKEKEKKHFKKDCSATWRVSMAFRFSGGCCLRPGRRGHAQPMSRSHNMSGSISSTASMFKACWFAKMCLCVVFEPPIKAFLYCLCLTECGNVQFKSLCDVTKGSEGSTWSVPPCVCIMLSGSTWHQF